MMSESIDRTNTPGFRFTAQPFEQILCIYRNTLPIEDEFPGHCTASNFVNNKRCTRHVIVNLEVYHYMSGYSGYAFCAKHFTQFLLSIADAEPNEILIVKSKH